MIHKRLWRIEAAGKSTSSRRLHSLRGVRTLSKAVRNALWNRNFFLWNLPHVLSEWPTILPSPLTHPTIMVPLKSEYFLHLAVVDVRRSIFGVGVGDQTVFLRIRSTSTHNNNSCSNWLFYEFEPNLKLPTVGSIMIRVSQVSELRLERREGSVRIRFSQISTSRPFTSVLSVSLCFPAVGALPNPGHGVGHSCEDP